jgi:hypothetical protein
MANKQNITITPATLYVLATAPAARRRGTSCNPYVLSLRSVYWTFPVPVKIGKVQSVVITGRNATCQS